MKPVKFLQKISVALATIGMLVPNVGIAFGAESQSSSRPSAAIVDVSLVDGGVLQGQVVDGNGVVQANAPVTVHQGKNAIATATTNKNGEFAVKGLKGGMYVVSTTGAAGVVRAWAPRTAPPSAVKGILLVPGDQAVRAQLGLADNWGTGAIVVGAIAATVIVVSIDHSSGS